MDTTNHTPNDRVMPNEPAPEFTCPTGKAKKRRLWLIPVALLLALCLTAGIVGALFWMDYQGTRRTPERITITVPVGSSTTAIATILEEGGLIDHAFFFRLYTRFNSTDEKWQPGTYTLAGDTGYTGLIDALQTIPLRESVDVTIPPQYTVEEIAATLEDKGVCSAAAFIDAVQNGQFSQDFVAAIPSGSGRVYRLEGYLCPDTYNFHTNSEAWDVVNRMLDNFAEKLTDELRGQIAARGWTLDEAMIFASLIEGEAGTPEDMEKVSRVLQNRLEPNSGFANLQLCSTRDYVNHLSASANPQDYNTYLRAGLPIGPINNPGIQALEAALNPSQDAYIAGCYFFATDYSTGITYFSQTLAQHNQAIAEHDIHDLG